MSLEVGRIYFNNIPIDGVKVTDFDLEPIPELDESGKKRFRYSMDIEARDLDIAQVFPADTIVITYRKEVQQPDHIMVGDKKFQFVSVTEENGVWKATFKA